jgi:hypothetical protein
MSPIRKNSCEATLRDVRTSIITLVCELCDMHCDLDRKVLVKRYGASLSFSNLRRRMVVGCERMNNDQGVAAARRGFRA